MSLAPLGITAITGGVPRIDRSMPMTGTGTTGTGGTSGSGSSGSTSTAGSSELDREAFLKLLVAQLKYQDPSSPMDASAMMTQTAQLTMVDKLDEMNDLLTTNAMVGQLTLAGSVVGKQITFTDPDGFKQAGVVASVRFNNGQMILSIPNWDVPMESVESIGLPTATETGTTGTGATGTGATGAGATGTGTTGTSSTGSSTDTSSSASTSATGADSTSTTGSTSSTSTSTSGTSDSSGSAATGDAGATTDPDAP